MDLSSWLRGNIKKTRKSDSVKRQEEVLGVTDQLIDTVKSFSFHTFKNFPLQDDQGINGGDNSQATSTNIGKDLSEWQERHAMLVLSKVKVQAYFTLHFHTVTATNGYESPSCARIWWKPWVVAQVPWILTRSGCLLMADAEGNSPTLSKDGGSRLIR
ncbi:hypothetical protein CK203_095162 [Vitis vinifera]|uniref:Uncharacterized protein n=1 Tax=Vitis vinifera TaxID=29760 RepID=A0A438C883_VITVI|nr:hypothetical protein CK203_095162 [Vitis vinifera]